MKRIAAFLLALFATSAFSEDLPEHFIKRYEGTLDGKMGITVMLAGNGEEVSGTYYYHRKGMPIELTGSISVMGKIDMKESTYNADGDEVVTGIWNINTTEDGSLRGTWKASNNAKPLALTLKEMYPAGSIPTVVTNLTYSSKKGRGGEELGVSRECQYVQFQSTSPAATAINAKLRQHVIEPMLTVEDDADGKPIARPVKTPTAAEIEALVYQPANKEDEDWEAAYVNETITSMEVIFNERNFLCIKSNYYEYSGGAHGNHGAGYYVFSLKTGEELTLKNLLKPGYEKSFTKLGEADLKVQASVQPDAPLHDAGLSIDALELTDNWFVNAGGIGFSYSPYEIASYARGYVVFTLPWKDIQSWIDTASPLRPLIPINTK